MQIPYDEILQANILRNVGNKILLLNEGNLSEDSRIKLEKLISEKFEVYKIRSENHWDDVRFYFSEYVLNFDFGFTQFVEDEKNGDMHIIVLPRNGNFSEEDIQFLQQIYEDPVVFD